MTISQYFEFAIEVNPHFTFIQEALEILLYVPDERVKPKIIEEIVNYYSEKLNTPDHRVAIFIASQRDIPIGMVMTQIDPEYRTYSRKATTFSWLLCEDYATCKALMGQVERFARENKLKKIRGPINYPKIVGGIGIQTAGFDVAIMNGINFNHPGSKILTYLNKD